MLTDALKTLRIRKQTSRSKAKKKEGKKPASRKSKGKGKKAPSSRKHHGDPMDMDALRLALASLEDKSSVKER